MKAIKTIDDLSFDILQVLGALYALVVAFFLVFPSLAVIYSFVLVHYVITKEYYEPAAKVCGQVGADIIHSCRSLHGLIDIEEKV